MQIWFVGESTAPDDVILGEKILAEFYVFSGLGKVLFWKNCHISFTMVKLILLCKKKDAEFISRSLIVSKLR